MSMRRLPSDSQYGVPVANLKGTDTVLFQNGTIANFEENDGSHDKRVFQKYEFYYTDVNHISKVICRKPDVIPRKIANLNSFQSTLFTTFTFLLILILVYVLSYDLISQVTRFTSLFNSYSGAIELVIALIVLVGLGIEFVLFDYLKKDKFVINRLEIYSINRDTPHIIMDNGITNSRFLFNMHNMISRLVIVLAIVEIPENKDFFIDLITFMKSLILVNLMVDIFIIVLLLTLLPRRIIKKRNYSKVEELRFEDFFELSEKSIAENKKLSLKKSNFENKSLEQLLSQNESSGLEFKSSIWTTNNDKTRISWKTNDGKEIDTMKDKLQDNIIKAIAGFLNKNGGVLLIGVKDNPFDFETPTVGIKLDFRHLKSGHQNEEGYKNRIAEFIDEAFGNKTTRQIYLDIECELYNEHLICRINVQPVERFHGKQVWAKTKTMGEEVFFVRGTAGTDKLKPSEANNYIYKYFNESELKKDE